jgi:hypothetical protein
VDIDPALREVAVERHLRATCVVEKREGCIEKPEIARLTTPGFHDVLQDLTGAVERPSALRNRGVGDLRNSPVEVDIRCGERWSEVVAELWEPVRCFTKAAAVPGNQSVRDSTGKSASTA